MKESGFAVTRPVDVGAIEARLRPALLRFAVATPWRAELAGELVKRG